MGDNRGILAKRFESRVKFSCGPFKPWFWSLDPADCRLLMPDSVCIKVFTQLHACRFEELVLCVQADAGGWGDEEDWGIEDDTTLS